MEMVTPIEAHYFALSWVRGMQKIHDAEDLM